MYNTLEKQGIEKTGCPGHRSVRRWKDNSELELKELECRMDWSGSGKDQFLALVNIVVNTGCHESRGISWVAELLLESSWLPIVESVIDSQVDGSQQSPERRLSSSADCRSAGQQIPRLPLNRVFQYRVHKSSPLNSILSQLNTIRIFITYFLKNTTELHKKAS
jgi:hypothetical protein